MQNINIHRRHGRTLYGHAGIYYCQALGVIDCAGINKVFRCWRFLQMILC